MISEPLIYFTYVFGLAWESTILMVSDGEGVTIPPAGTELRVPKNLCGVYCPSDLIAIWSFLMSSKRL